MANDFDQFDEQPKPSVPDSGNAFDQFDAETSASSPAARGMAPVAANSGLESPTGDPDKTWMGDVGRAFGRGAGGLVRSGALLSKKLRSEKNEGLTSWVGPAPVVLARKLFPGAVDTLDEVGKQTTEAYAGNSVETEALSRWQCASITHPSRWLKQI